MSCSLDILSKVTTLANPVHVALPTGSIVLVTQAGSINFNNHFHIDNVFFVLSFHYNLLSVPKWTHETSGHVSFSANMCTFQDQNLRQKLALGKLKDGLYHLELQNASDYSTNFGMSFVRLSYSNIALTNHQLSALWHMRLDNVSFPVLLQISSVVEHVNDACNKSCLVCLLSKQSNLSFNLSTSHASHIFD